MEGRVLAVHRSADHSFSKFAEDTITLVPGLGVAGDAHAGATVQHRSRVARDPSAPNLRQVHLLHAELFDELVERDFAVFPGDLGENITTRGLNLLELPTGTRLRIGSAEIELTGLRNPCSQIDRFQRGLTAAVLDRDAAGELVRKAGVMAIVHEGGEIRAGDAIVVHLPPAPYRPLAPV
ncbi:MOSC domain-containing protein [Ramlibacter sp. XY19]|uniref:MOSC domain-containing protein n=1 Tax=Ramlibacter paludis TaxID=2908000 RepID=UPI0023DB1118|nr:MOSC domain-containing protein [Ramlibacter paludis]MCG2595010.1 MOSC domain-containing protein [Ramlibacter paludis]